MKYLHIYSWNTILNGNFVHMYYLETSFKDLIVMMKSSKRAEKHQTVKHMIVNTIIYSRLHLDKKT